MYVFVSNSLQAADGALGRLIAWKIKESLSVFAYAQLSCLVVATCVYCVFLGNVANKGAKK
jgi:hypothetical protein